MQKGNKLTYVSQSPPKVAKETSGGCCNEMLTGYMPILSANQQCQSTEDIRQYSKVKSTRVGQYLLIFLFIYLFFYFCVCLCVCVCVKYCILCTIYIIIT